MTMNKAMTFVGTVALLLLAGCSKPAPALPAQGVTVPTVATQSAGTSAGGQPVPAQAQPAAAPPGLAQTPPQAAPCKLDYTVDDFKRGREVAAFTADLNQKLATTSPAEAVKALGPCYKLMALNGSSAAINVISHSSGALGYGALAVRLPQGWKAYPLTRMPEPGDKSVPRWLMPERAFDTPQGARILIRTQMPGSGAYGSMEVLQPEADGLKVITAFGTNNAKILGDGLYTLSQSYVQEPADLGLPNAQMNRWQQTLHQFNGETYVQKATRLIPHPMRTATWFAGYVSKGDLAGARTLATSDAIVGAASEAFKLQNKPVSALVLTIPRPQLPEGADLEYTYWEALPEALRGQEPPGGKVLWPFGTHTLTIERQNGEWLVTAVTPK